MREKIYRIVHIYEGTVMSVAYKYVMVAAIVLSLIPLTVKGSYPFFAVTEMACLVIFSADFILRWITADYRLGGRGARAFIKYPFRLISIIDLMSVFALFCSVTGAFSEYGITKALAVFRLIRVLRYSKSVQTILDILRYSKRPLMAVGSLAVGYIVISAIVIFNVEPDTFETFFDAIYWATVSLTTVGYGDIYPVSTVGQTVAMVSSFFGIAVVALPAGIVTAEYLGRIKKESGEDREEK